MIFHENCLLADNSHEISYLIFSKIRKDVAKLSSDAVVIGALKVKVKQPGLFLYVRLGVNIHYWPYIYSRLCS